MNDDEREKYPSELAERFQVRLPAGLRDRIKSDAEKHNRSMNAEIVARLEDFPKIQRTLFDEARERARLTDENERLDRELDRLEKIRERFFEKDGREKPVLAVPRSLMDRIRIAAAQNHRTVDAEATAALEAAFPPKSIDLELLAEFLNSLVGPYADDPDRPEYESYINDINNVLARLKSPWTIKADPLGIIAFYPYGSSETKRDGEDE